MAISDGQRVNATNSNAAWMSRTVNTSTTGKVDLQNTDPASGTSQTNVQAEMNGQNKFVGRTANTGKDSLPTWTNNNYGTVSDDLKARAEAHDAAIATNENRLDGHDTDIADLVTLSGEAANATTHGTFTGATIPDASTTHGALQSLETAVELRELASNKGIPSGYASLDAGGKVPVSELPDTVLGAVQYQGTWNATTNVPDLPASTPEQGDYYVVSVAGSTSLGGITDWNVGDWAIFNGTIWQKVDNTDAVTSVNSQTGVVVLDTDDVSEGATNKYYATSLFNTDFATKDTDDLSEGATNKYYSATLFNADFATKDTDDLAEGATNKYYTDAAVDARIALASIDDLADVDTSTSPPTDGQALIWDNANSEWIPGDAGGGTGQGGINYITNYGAEDNTTTGWAVYKDADQATPENGTGGSPSTTWTVVSASGSILRGLYSFYLTKLGGASRRGEGVSYDFTIDNADKGDPLTISFDYYLGTGTYDGINELVSVWVYDVTNALLITVNGTEQFNGNLSSTGTSPADARKFIGQFYANNNSTSYRLIIHIAGSSSLAYSMVFDNFRVGPEAFYNMPIVSPWTAYTPTFAGLGSVSSLTAKYRRVGDTVEVDIEGTTGTPTATTLTISLPLSLTTIAGAVIPVGVWHRGIAGLTSVKTGAICSDTSASNTLFCSYNDYDVAASPFTAQNGSALYGSSEQFTFKASVQVTQWANSSTAMSTTQANLQVQRAKYASTSSSALPTSEATVVLATQVYNTGGISYNTSTGVGTIMLPGYYRLYYHLLPSNNATITQLITRVRKNSTVLASKVTPRENAVLSYLTSDVVAVDYFNVGDTFDCRNFVTVAADSYTGGASDHFFEIERLPDFTTLGVYSPYEVKGTTSSEKTPSGANTFLNMTGNSLTLTPGTWELLPSNIRWSNSAVVAYGRIIAGWFSTNGADTSTQPTALSSTSGVTLHTATDTYAGRADHSTGGANDWYQTTASVIFTCTSTVTVYLVPYLVTATTPSNARVTVYANAKRLK